MHLTYHKPERNVKPASSAMAEGTGAPEIEVTPAMFEAGLAAYFDEEGRFSDLSDLLERIFRAMMKARLAPSSAALPATDLCSDGSRPRLFEHCGGDEF